MKMRLQRSVLALVCVLLYNGAFTAGAVCKTATVGQPFTDCFDIYTNASITATQFASFNPGLNCSTLQLGQKVCISAGTLPSTAPQPQANGTCAEYTTVPLDSCSAIGVKFDITVAQIEEFNADTFKWKGCSDLQVNFTMCVSSGKPPPISIIPGLQCGPQSEGNATCPLNVCCSAFGFCGLTDDFCSTTGTNPCISNCFTPTIPSCSTSRSMRKIGYYAGWGNRRACGTNVSPDQINWTGFTGAHFAFATISQGLQIQLDDVDVPLLQSLVAQKANNPGMKVLIAVGGWDFSEDDPTRDLFSVMIATTTSRATFISSVQSFLSEFSLDGIDIDFEYPGAIERNAPATDTPNLTAFFQELRTALGSKVISCAAPAGYWFLQGFEIDKIATSVTYLNMMSYDYHGPWDTNVTDQAPVTNPHTSILDMHDSTLLYLRAGIHLAKVNLGLAYYARTYKLASASCKGYNCTMVGGGAAGPCTATAGILAQFEVDDLLNSGGITATLDSNSETYWFDNKGSLATFDQEDTWAAKTTFAESSCFGGTFIWSLDQRTDNLVDGGSGSGSGAERGGTFSTVVWNPNPFPSPGAASETFIQKPGTVLSTFTTIVGAPTTSTVIKTFTLPAFTSTTTQFTALSGTIKTLTGTTVIPAVTSTTTIGVTVGSTVTSTSLVTKTATTVIIPVPTTSTSVVIQGVTITLKSGGTPINSPVPTFITQPSAITPTWKHNISPSPNATVVIFTAPLSSTQTWSTTVPVPSKSDSPVVTVTGPPGDKSRCSSSNIWTLLFHAIIGGCLPLDVGIIDGITPSPIRPPHWTGSWVDPFPLPTGGPPDTEPSPTNSHSTSTSSTSSSTSSSTISCPTLTPSYNLPDDPENADTDTLGTDPDQRRRRDLKSNIHALEEQHEVKTKKDVLRNATLQQRASAREAKIPYCGLTITSPSSVTLVGGIYFLVPFDQNGGSGTTLKNFNVSAKPDGPPNFLPTNQEHVFEIGYINQFFTFLALATRCDWIKTDVVDYTRVAGSNPPTLGQALIVSIDNIYNMVWVDKPMNQAKSNVVNNNKLSPSDPPQFGSLLDLLDFQTSEEEIIEVETFIRNFGALGQYFADTSVIFRNTSINFMTLLSEITPSRIPDIGRSIPVIFRDWLISTLQDYPSGCTIRANNIWNSYRDTIHELAIDTNKGQLPSCFPLFNANNFQPSSFNFMNLIPAAPALPSCNVPGTEGTVGYVSGSTTVTSIPFDIVPQRTMGSGNLNFYAVGSGTSLTDAHYQAVDASHMGPACNNVASMLNDLPGTGVDVNIAFQCNGATGAQTVDFNFVVNGQSLGCVGVITGHSDGETTEIFCAVSQGDALNCALASFPLNSAFTLQMRWFPS